MKTKTLAFLTILFLSLAGSKAFACSACDLVVTNKIDCTIELDIRINCGGIISTVTVNITGGTAANPTIVNPLNSAIYCNYTVEAVIVKKINGIVPSSGIAGLGPATTTITMANVCCPTNYGTWDGQCDVQLWMQCP